MSHKQHATKNNTARHAAKLRSALRYWGLFSRVARELGLGKNGRSHVRRVALGERASARVQLALMQEVKRIEHTARKEAA